MNETSDNRGIPAWYGEAAQSIAPVGFLMAGFLPMYSIWFGLAWGVVGWVAFAISLLISVFLANRSIKNYRHSKKFIFNKSESGKKIGKAMAKLSVVSYSTLWIAVIIFFLTGHYKYILPWVTFVIALHFFPQAQIFNRNIDYFIAPFPVASSIVAFVFAYQTSISLFEVYAIAGIGGAISTAAYGAYALISYKNISRTAGVYRS